MSFPVVDSVNSSDEQTRGWGDETGVLDSAGEALPVEEQAVLPLPVAPVTCWEVAEEGVERAGEGAGGEGSRGDSVVTRVRRRTICACLCWIFGTTLGLLGVPLMIEAACHLSAFGTLLSGLMLARASLKEPEIQVILLKGTNLRRDK